MDPICPRMRLVTQQMAKMRLKMAQEERKPKPRPKMDSLKEASSRSP